MLPPPSVQISQPFCTNSVRRVSSSSVPNREYTWKTHTSAPHTHNIEKIQCKTETRQNRPWIFSAQCPHEDSVQRGPPFSTKWSTQCRDAAGSTHTSAHPQCGEVNLFARTVDCCCRCWQDTSSVDLCDVVALKRCM